MNHIERAVIQMLRDTTTGKVMYASLLGQMRRIEMNNSFMQTAGVCTKQGRIYLYWSEEFFQPLTDAERVAVLEHECLHLVFLHQFRGRDKQWPLYNIAADLAINQLIDHLPASATTVEVMNAKFKNLNLIKGKSAEYYYDALHKYMKGFKITQNGDGSITVTRPDGSETTIKPMDSHQPWNKNEDGTENSNDGSLTSLDVEVIKHAVKEAYESSNARAQGSLPSGVIEALNELFKAPTIPWTRLLKQWVGNHVKGKSKYTWKNLNRRFTSEDFKGKTRTRMLRIAAAIDTSGSISQDIFNEFFSELKGIQHAYKSKFTIMEVDAEVQKVYELTPYSSPDRNLKGRGGTSFIPAFEYIKEHSLNIDLLIYFTDMMGSFPEQSPSYPTLWVVPSDMASYYGKKNQLIAPFGDMIFIEKS